MSKAILKKGREESLLRFHPWVFSGAIAQLVGNPAEGDVVSVWASDGTLLGCGHYQIGSIAVRMLSFGQEHLSESFWTDSINAAFLARKAFGLVDGASTNCYRLVHGEGDGLPGLIVDYYDGVCVMQAHSVGMFRAKKQVAEALRSVYGASLKAVYDKSSGTAPFKAGLELVDGYLYKAEGFESSEAVVLENGHKFLVNWNEGQKTGFFLDQKYNRQAAARLAQDRRVLDCFTHTGAFALNAAAAGAAHVTAVDVSQFALELAAENGRRNGLTNLDYLCADVFDLLTRMAREKKCDYDYIILDPPAFTKSRATADRAYHGYKEINLKAMRLLPRGGYLATCSCSHFMSDEMFRRMLREAAQDAGVTLRQIEARQQAPDHPILPGVPETDYLKFYLLQVV